MYKRKNKEIKIEPEPCGTDCFLLLVRSEAVLPLLTVGAGSAPWALCPWNTNGVRQYIALRGHKVQIKRDFGTHGTPRYGGSGTVESVLWREVRRVLMAFLLQISFIQTSEPEAVLFELSCVFMFNSRKRLCTGFILLLFRNQCIFKCWTVFP